MTLPDHPNKHIREAIEYAEINGWRVVKANARAHIWGRLYCPFRDREGCAKAVYSTPRSPETTQRIFAALWIIVRTVSRRMSGTI